MSFKVLNDEIERIVNTIADTTFLRAHPNEANTALDKVNIGSNCMVIHHDRGEASYSKSTYGNYVFKQIETEILFLYKNTRLDDKQTDIDTLIDQAESKADEFFDKMLQSSVFNEVAPYENPTLERLTAYKRFDAVTSGVNLVWTIPINKQTYYCGT
jgi:hypothetical protein